jgi:hypothetical protein
MDYKITYNYKAIEDAILIQDQPNIIFAIGQFYEDFEKGCEILKIERY